MKILFVLKDMKLSNGVASFAMNYYRQLNGNEINIDFLIVSDMGSPYYDEIKNNGNNVFLMPSYKRNLVSAISYVKHLLSHNNYDIVHCNVLNSGSVILMLAKKNNVPVRILHSHATQTGDRKWKEIRNKIFCTISLFYANYYFSCSKKAGDYLFGVNKYYLIPNAVDIKKYSFNSEQRSLRRREENCGNKMVIITVGRLTKQKNPQFIVDIVRELRRKNIDFSFWWFGNGEMEKVVKSYARKLRVENYIKFWGSSPEINEYYSAADVFILPSLYEGLPVAGIEAQMTGLPVLLSEKITKETKISNAVEFLPITNADIWAERILNYKNFNRTENLNSLQTKQYDIVNQSTKLKELYNILIMKENNKNEK